MKKSVLHLLCALPISIPIGQIGYADVVPPGPTIFVLSVAGIVVLGVLVGIIVLVSILVIRAIRKKQASKD